MLSAAQTVTAPAFRTAPLDAAGLDGMSLRWEQRGPFQHNWDASVHSTTDKSGTRLDAMVDTNGLFVRARRTDATDRYGKAAQGAVASTFLADAAARAGAVMVALPGNVTKEQFEHNAVKPGEFALSFDLTGTSKDYYYVGLIKTAPQSVLDLLQAAREVRSHL